MGIMNSRETDTSQSQREKTEQTVIEEMDKDLEEIRLEEQLDFGFHFLGFLSSIMRNLKTCEKDTSQSLKRAEVMKTDLEEMEKEMDEIQDFYQSARVRCCVMMKKRETLIKFAVDNIKNEAVVQWLRENSESQAFCKLVDMYDFLKKHIDDEEKKDHGNNVDIIIMAHGSITDPMIPASCLLPLPPITDVLLYTPWNCAMTADAAYGVATGLLKPWHRVFYYTAKDNRKNPEEKHQPMKLPNHWNSLKKAGDQMIPNITLCPLKPPLDGFWKKFESLTKQHGPPGKNRIIIPYILPRHWRFGSSESVPFFIITLALSLVLLSSRFTATVHLITCLTNKSAGQKLNTEYLKQQYTCTTDDTGMTVSPDMFSMNSAEILKSG